MLLIGLMIHTGADRIITRLSNQFNYATCKELVTLIREKPT